MATPWITWFLQKFLAEAAEIGDLHAFQLIHGQVPTWCARILLLVPTCTNSRHSVTPQGVCTGRGECHRCEAVFPCRSYQPVKGAKLRGPHWTAWLPTVSRCIIRRLPLASIREELLRPDQRTKLYRACLQQVGCHTIPS